MTQWGLAQGEHGARAGKASLASTAVIALGIAMLCGGATTTAAAPMPMRHVSAARQITSEQTSHAKLHSRTSRSHAENHSSKSASSKGAAVRSNRPKYGSAQHTADRPIAKPEVGSRKRRHKQPTQSDNPDPPALHRASANRRRGERPVRLVHQAIAARTPEPLLTASSDQAHTDQPKDGHHGADVPVPAVVKALTVSDFLRAASTPAVPAPEIYASGESHPDEDVSSSQMREASSAPKTLPAKRAFVVARVEAAPMESAPLSIEHAAPSDLVGAPLSSPERTTRTTVGENDSAAAGLRAPSRQELIEEVEQPVVLPGLYRNGRLVVPPALKGTREILIHQNLMADDEGLQRVQDDYDLRRMRTARQLVDFPENASLHVNAELAGNRRCARPWAVRFASDMAQAYYARFHQPLQVNSAVRTVAYQVRLRRVNGNAAGVDGDVASPHLTGEALDFGKRGMSMQEIAWMRTYLLPLMRGGKLDVEEEFQQSCFHISVYRAYLPATKRRSVARSEVAQLREPRVPRIAARSDQDQ